MQVSYHENLHSIADVSAVLAANQIHVDTIYQDVFRPAYRYGMVHNALGVHIYFNAGRRNYACFTPSLGVLQVFDPPRADAMVGDKHYLQRPVAASAPDLSVRPQ